MRKCWLVLSTCLCLILLSGCVVATSEAVENPSELDEVTGEPNVNWGSKDNPAVDDKSEVAKQEQELLEEQEEEPKFVSPYTFTYPDAVRGIYVTGHSAGGARFDKLLQLIDTTDLNAMVIDIKDDHGYLTFRPQEQSPYYDISQPYIKDIHQLLQTLEAHNVYPIARIVVFKDTVRAKQSPAWSFLDNGQVWENRRGESFINPFLKEVWDYNIGVAKLAAELGFQEIQFDYVRFPEGFEKRDELLQYSLGDYQDKSPTKLLELDREYLSDLARFEKDAKQLRASIEQEKDLEMKNNLQEQFIQLEANKPQKPELSSQDISVQLRVDAISDFVAYAQQELQEYGVDVSVDIFGYTATLPEAPGIGQNFTKISKHVDVISSMIYPSHWTAYFGIPKPDLEPYRLVTEYVKMESAKLAELENPPVSRPWIQDFTASWLGKGNYQKYGAPEVEAQIKALNEAGINEFLLWNAGNNYTEGVNYLPLER